jgi:hypothetical protein
MISRNRTFEDSYGDIFDLKKSKFKNGNRHLLNSEKFENYLTGFLFAFHFANQNYYSDLEEIIAATLLNIDAEIK